MMAETNPTQRRCLARKPPHRNSLEMVADGDRRESRQSKFIIGLAVDRQLHPEVVLSGDQVPYASGTLRRCSSRRICIRLTTATRRAEEHQNSQAHGMTEWMYMTGWLVREFGQAPGRSKKDSCCARSGASSREFRTTGMPPHISARGASLFSRKRPHHPL